MYDFFGSAAKWRCGTTGADGGYPMPSNNTFLVGNGVALLSKKEKTLGPIKGTAILAALLACGLLTKLRFESSREWLWQIGTFAVGVGAAGLGVVVILVRWILRVLDPE